MTDVDVISCSLHTIYVVSRTSQRKHCSPYIPPLRPCLFVSRVFWCGWKLQPLQVTNEAQAAKIKNISNTEVAEHKIPLYLTTEFLHLSFCSKDSQGALCDSYAATGDNFTVLLTYNLKDTEKLKWSREQTQIVERKPLKNNGRVIDQKLVAESNYDIYQNGSLKLTKLNRSHTGSYMPRVYRDDGTSVADFKSLRLCVLGRWHLIIGIFPLFI